MQELKTAIGALARTRTISPWTMAMPFVFFGSQTPIDLVTGKLATGFADMPADAQRKLRSGLLMVDGPDERILAQAWQLISNMHALLAENGGKPSDIVHQRFFLQDIRDRAALEAAIVALSPEGPASTTIVETRSSGMNAEIAVQGDFIALAAESGLKCSNVSIPALDHLSVPFPLATRAGQYIFTTPIAGIDTDTGRLAMRLADLSESERKLGEPPYAQRGESVAAQQLMIFRHIETILQSQGSSLAWQLRQNGWMRLPMREFGPASRVRKQLFSGANIGPFTTVQVSGLRQEEAHFEYGVIALVPPSRSGEYTREIHSGGHGIANYYVGAVRCGPLVITAGEVPVDTSIPKVIQSFADLQGEEPFIDYGRAHAAKPILAQAYFVYDKLKACLEENGSSIENAVHQTVYMVDPSDFPAVERIATLFFGPRLPPTTLIPIEGTSPYASAELEIEMFASS